MSQQVPNGAPTISTSQTQYPEPDHQRQYPWAGAVRLALTTPLANPQFKPAIFGRPETYTNDIYMGPLPIQPNPPQSAPLQFRPLQPRPLQPRPVQPIQNILQITDGHSPQHREPQVRELHNKELQNIPPQIREPENRELQNRELHSKERHIIDLQNRELEDTEPNSTAPNDADQSPSNHVPSIDQDFLEDGNRDLEDDDDFSDADSEYLELRDNIAKYKDSVRKFRAQQRDRFNGEARESSPVPHSPEEEAKKRTGKGSRGRYRKRGQGRLRGPRKAAEPTGDIRLRLELATQAFIEENYEEAREIVSEIIRINAETYRAWTLLASIWKELGDLNLAVLALMSSAHLRPKEPDVWIDCARFILEGTGSEREKFLTTAKFCYSGAIRADKNNYEARLGKALLSQEMGNARSAINDYQRLLLRHPHDTSILRLMAESYIDVDDVEAAKSYYRQSIVFYKTKKAAVEQFFTWSDLNIYIELYGYLGQYAEGICELKSLSRWLLQRSDESFWDTVSDDDREWDKNNTRRSQVPEFREDEANLEQYGNGLPLELRVKLGLFRLRLGHKDEAISHFLWLDPKNVSGSETATDYPDLYRDVADGLVEAHIYEEAVAFYEALQALPSQNDPIILLQLGRCYAKQHLEEKAEKCFQDVLVIDEKNVEARIELARVYEAVNDEEQAFVYVTEVMNLRKAGNTQTKGKQASEAVDTSDTFMPPPPAKRSRHKSRNDPMSQKQAETEKAEFLQGQYVTMLLEQTDMLAGSDTATRAWMAAAAPLIEDFRGFRQFYPWDKYVQFLGYSSGTSSMLTGATPLDTDLSDMADRLSNKLNPNNNGASGSALEIPENYRGISFSDWLDIFLQYALCLVKFQRRYEAYEICESAKDAIIWYHSREDMFLITVCHCTCALIANDEETHVAVSRYFMKEYQFTSDSYRMFGALTRLSQSPVSWYASGPTQKYVLRQIKAMDYSLVSEDSRARFTGEKSSYTAKDNEGNTLVNKDLDIALIMVYGHILYAGASYSYALNYFFRAYALDPENPMINLCLGLGYVHYALKRQAQNRQYHIMQGMAFMFRYYDSRVQSSHSEERQEAHFNIGRTYHMLGLTHLALPYYLKVLREEEESPGSREELVREAAYAMQSSYMTSGSPALAKAITDRWLSV